jgi:hypothetical protein
VVVFGAECGGDHSHAAAWADRRTVVVIHAVVIPGSGESDGVPVGRQAAGLGERFLSDPKLIDERAPDRVVVVVTDAC